MIDNPHFISVYSSSTRFDGKCKMHSTSKSNMKRKVRFRRINSFAEGKLLRVNGKRVMDWSC